jgi:hypothetical protein
MEERIASPSQIPPDSARRHALRSFLVECRSQFLSGNVALLPNATKLRSRAGPDTPRHDPPSGCTTLAPR